MKKLKQTVQKKMKQNVAEEILKHVGAAPVKLSADDEIA